MIPGQNKNCKYCGAFLDETARFCENCGRPVAEAPISRPQPWPLQAVPLPPVRSQYASIPALPQTNNPSMPAPKKRGIACLTVGLVLLFGGLCLAVLAVGGYFVYKNFDSPAQVVAPTSVNKAPTPKRALPTAIVRPTKAAVPTSLNKTPTPKPTLPTAIVLPTPTLAPTNENSIIPACPGAPPSRLHKGDHAQIVNVGGYSLIFYDQPQSNANEVGAVPEGARVIIRDGPVCAENSYWWLAEFGEGGQSGWAKETASDGTYLLDPG